MNPTASSQYREFGWDAQPTDAHRYLYPTLRRMLADDKGRTILDLGCGNGVIAGRLLDEGYDVYGLDLSASGISIANEAHPGRFFVHDLALGALPEGLREIPFDLVVSTEVVEHLYSPRDFMRMVTGLIGERGGEIILSTPYHGYLKNLALALTNRLDAHFAALWDGGHIKFWSRRTLTRLLQEFGFEVTEFRGAGRMPYLWKSMFVRARLPARAGAAG